MLDTSTLFDEKFYLARNQDVAQAVAGGIFGNGYDHFIKFGQNERRSSSALFNTAYYLATNQDVEAVVKRGEITAVDHFIRFGQIEGRDPTVLFDTAYYLAQNSDVATAVSSGGLTGIEHFAKFGEFEDRNPSALFNPSYYLARNTDVAAAVQRDELTGIEHYIQFGAAEGRQFTPLIDLRGSTLPNGIAAGDTTQTSTVLWTRSTAPGTVTFEYSTDSNFGNILGTLSNVTTDPTVPIKVQVTNLTPGTQYFYRVRDAAGTTLAGQFRTPAGLGTRAGLRFGVAGDWQGQLAPFPAIANAPGRNLDFFARIGDSAYVDDLSPDLPGVRQPKTAIEFNTKQNEVYAQRYGINSWANVQATTTTYATWDDHELTNDFAGGAAPAVSPQKEGIFGTGEGFVNDTPVFDNALQAFQAYNPLRNDFYGETGDPRTANEQKLYRFNTFGSDAAMFMLDLRSFRDAPLRSIAETSDQATVNQFLSDVFQPNRTLLGGVQLQELKNDLLATQNAGVTWKFIMSTDPIQNFGIPVAGDRWEGYAAQRTDLLRFIQQNNIKNVVFVSGDFHGFVTNNVTYQEGFGQPQIPTDVIDVMTNPVAIQLNIGQGPFAAPFGPATVAFTPNAVLPQSEKDRYNALTDVSQKDAFVRQVIDNRIIPLGYDPLGLDNNLAIANGQIDATLLNGSYVAAHYYGWNEFNIDRQTQQLRVITYGIEPYSQPQLDANPSAIVTREPTVINEFIVNPKV